MNLNAVYSLIDLAGTFVFAMSGALAARERPGTSPREREVLEGPVFGLSYKMIADKLNISFGTVRSHVKKVSEKLHVHNSAEAFSMILKGGSLR